MAGSENVGARQGPANLSDYPPLKNLCRQGWPVYRRTLFLFFSGAAGGQLNRLAVPARLKNKKKDGGGCAGAINRPPLTGFQLPRRGHGPRSSPDTPRAGGQAKAGQAGHLMDVELVHDLLPVLLDGLDADAKFAGDLLVGKALRN